MKLLFGLLVQMGIIFIILFSSCSFEHDSFDKYSGTVMIGQKKISRWNIGTGRRDMVEDHRRWRSQRLLCIGPDSTVIMAGSYGYPPPQHTSLYRVFPTSMTIKLVEQLPDSSFRCSALDYYAPSESFLYSGMYNGRERGVFLLDKEFSMITDLTKELFDVLVSERNIPGPDAGVRDTHLRASFVDSASILVSSVHGVFKYNWRIKTASELVPYRLICMSNNRKNTLVVRSHDERVPYLLDVVTMEVLPLDLGAEFFGPACFSPGDSEILFGTVAGILDDGIRFYVYDFETGGSHKTTQYYGRGRFPIPIWLPDDFL